MPDAPKYVDSVGRLLTFATRATGALTQQMLTEHNLTIPQWVALTALWRQDGLAVSEVARYTKAKLPATSRLLGRMEQRGLIQRRSREGDRRSVYVWLTEEGKGMRPLLELFREVNDLVLEGFSDVEKRQLEGYLERVIANSTRHFAARSDADPIVQ